MWPEPGEALGRTIAAEQAIEDLYAEAFSRWAPAATSAALPTMAGQVYNGDPASVVLPPDAAAIAATSGQWSTTTEAVIVAGVALLWAAAVIEAMQALDIPLPDIDPVDAGAAVLDTFDSAVLRIVDRAIGDIDRDELHVAAGMVELFAPLREARNTTLAAHRTTAAQTLAVVQDKVTRAVADVPVPAEVPAAAVYGQQRDAAAAALNPGGQDLRDTARQAGYQAAGTLNHAVITAARQRNEEFAEDLQKCWIATLDGKTRPTHWAADGQRVALEAHFTVGAEQLFVPGDQTASPAEWKNCRCRVGVLAADESLPDEVDRHTERLDGRDSVVVNRDGRTQAEEIERRRQAGNVRARDTEDGIGRVASAAPSEEQENDMGKTSAGATTFADDDTTDVDEETFFTFTDALFAVTGIPTSDGRMLASDIDLVFRDTPMPLQWCETMEGGHYRSVTVGVVEALRFKNGEVRADGYMLNNEHAVKATDLLSHGVNNPSVDLADAEAVWTDEAGVPITEETYEDGMEMLLTVLKAEMTACTIVAIPAFGETRLRLNEQRETRDKALVAGLVASMDAAFKPPVYDPQMFADPKLTQNTRLTISEDGHVFGHIATWKDKHRSVGLGDIKPPRSETNYDHFHSSPPVHLADGTTLPVGRLTVGIGHAPTRGVSVAAAQGHYDNVEACWALGRIYEDRHGIVFSGVVAPWASPEKVQMGLASPLSGDWRPIGPRQGNLELVAVLSVNTPGFLCKIETDSTGRPLAMVASLSPSPRAGGSVSQLSLDDIKRVIAEALAESSAQSVELARRRDAALARAQAGPPPAPESTAQRMSRLLERV